MSSLIIEREAPKTDSRPMVLRYVGNAKGRATGRAAAAETRRARRRRQPAGRQEELVIYWQSYRM
jgi:hypothetical protein